MSGGITVVGQAVDGTDAVRQTRRLDPDVVPMDVRMPLMGGLAGGRAGFSPQRRPRPARGC
ncbi:MAG: hypothetical protein WB800_28665 [Streptosporangiaceae bacterium]